MKPSIYLEKWIQKGETILPGNNWIIFKEYGNYMTDSYDFYLYDKTLEDICFYLDTNQNNELNYKILDIGCGVGNVSLYFHSRGFSVTGLDINEARLKCARERLIVENKINNDEHFKSGHTELLKINLLELSQTYNSAFDIIWMQQTFHHLEPRTKILKKLYQLTKPGGVLIFSETNAMNFLMQAKLFFQRGFKTTTEKDVDGNKEMYGNERIISAFSLRKLLKESGFDVIKIKHYRVLPKRIARKLNLSLAKKIDENLGMIPLLSVHYSLVAKKSTHL